MKDFRKLQVWEKAHQLALTLYHVTASFPRDETYGLASQIRRAASSIPSNIAEGCGRDGDAELSPVTSTTFPAKPVCMASPFASLRV
ncbi:MAG: hypothetical protein DMG12_26140 [Acidobacteria bacterium]|nr:MAG: hypothetical protein DMG12_26140 [Acidobacteriota bacterium]